MEEYTCNNCEGTGIKPYKDYDFKIPCPKCGGKGKVDWLQNIMWNKNNIGKFESITIPLILHPYPKLIAEDIVGVDVKGKTND